MKIQDFSALSGKEMNVEYEVEGHSVILTDKHREKKAGAQTFFDGTVDGRAFEHKNVKGVCTFITGGKESVPRGQRAPRKVSTEPKHGVRLYSYEEAEKIASQTYAEYKAAKAFVMAVEARYSHDTEPNIYYTMLNEVLAKQQTAIRDAKKNARLKAVFEGRLQLRRERLQAAQAEVMADMMAGKTPTKKTVATLQALQTEVESFEKRVHVWQSDN